jgi:hypothetical protein
MGMEKIPVIREGGSFGFEFKNRSIVADKIEICGDALPEAEDSKILGKGVEIGEGALECAENSKICGSDIKIGRHALSGAKNSSLIGKRIEICGYLGLSGGPYRFSPPQNCYVFAKELLKIREIGPMYGGLIVARNIDAKNIYNQGHTVISQTPGVGVQLLGDWNAFYEDLLEKHESGDLEPFSLFGVEKKEIDREEFNKILEEINGYWNDIKGQLGNYMELADILELKRIWKMKNKEKYEYLVGLDKEIKKKLKSKLSVNDRMAEVLLNSKNRNDLIKELKDEDPEEFLKTFCDEESAIRYHLDFIEKNGLSDDYLLFEKTYVLGKCGKLEKNIDDIDNVNEILYNDGMELIGKIKTGAIALNPKTRKILKMEEESKKCKEILRQTRGRDAEAKEKLREIRKKVGKLKSEEIKRVKGSLKDYYSFDELKETLSQLSQHYLGGKPKEMAMKISDSIKVEENEISSNVMELGVWNKDIKNLPTYDEYRCCAFLGYSIYDIFDYMTDPSVQLLEIRVGEKKGMAITFATKHAGRNVLVVDSVESSSHIFGRKDVSEALIKGLKEYARASGFSELLVSTTPRNTAPKEFLPHAKAKGKRCNLKLQLPDVYLEAEGSYIRLH